MLAVEELVEPTDYELFGPVFDRALIRQELDARDPFVDALPLWRPDFRTINTLYLLELEGDVMQNILRPPFSIEPRTPRPPKRFNWELTAAFAFTIGIWVALIWKFWR